MASEYDIELGMRFRRSVAHGWRVVEVVSLGIVAVDFTRWKAVNISYDGAPSKVGRATNFKAYSLRIYWQQVTPEMDWDTPWTDPVRLRQITTSDLERAIEMGREHRESGRAWPADWSLVWRTVIGEPSRDFVPGAPRALLTAYTSAYDPRN